MPTGFRKNTRSGFIKTGSRTSRIQMGQPAWRPLHVRNKNWVLRAKVKPNVWWWMWHRRGFYRPKAGVDPLEARAVSKELIHGTLPERIVYQWLVNANFVPGADFDFQSCLWINHKVLTADLRWVEAGTLKPGDKLVSFDEQGPRRCYKVGTVMSNQIDTAEVMKVTLSDGSEIWATYEHPWLVYTDPRYDHPVKGSTLTWVRTDDLRPGLEIPKTIQPWEENHTWEAGYLAGFFDGEGSLVQAEQQHQGYYTNLTAAQNKGETLDNFVKAVASTGFDFSIYDYDGKYKRSYDDEARKAVAIRINGGMTEAMRFIGTIRPPRLLKKWNIDKMGGIARGKKVTIVSVEPWGRSHIARLGVDTHTYIAEGFYMHNSMEGGRLELGGIVVDYMFYRLKLVLQVQGPTHSQWLRVRKDEEQRALLEAMGYSCEFVDEATIYNEPRFEQEMRRIFNLGTYYGAGGGNVMGAYEPPEEGSVLMIDQIQAATDNLLSLFSQVQL